jgi:hypothetical protein
VVLQHRENEGVRKGRSIWKDGGSGRRSLAKADDGVVRVKSGVGQSPPVVGGWQGVEGGVELLAWPGKKRDGGGKKQGAARGGAAILYWRAEVGDGRQGGTTWQARAKRERGGLTGGAGHTVPGGCAG